MSQRRRHKAYEHNVTLQQVGNHVRIVVNPRGKRARKRQRKILAIDNFVIREISHQIYSIIVAQLRKQAPVKLAI